MAGGGKSTTPTTKKRPKRSPNLDHLTPLIPLLTSATSAVHTFLTQNDLHLLPSQTLSLESQIASTALSLSKLHSLLQTLNPSKTPPLLPSSPSSPPSQCWFQRFLFSNFSDTQWVESFRMSKPSFDLLLRTLSPNLQNSSSNLAPDYALGAFLYRFAHAASYKSVGRRFGVDSSVACKAFHEVCKALIDRLGHLFEFSLDLKRIVEGFGWISLPNCCGVLGFSRFLVEDGGLGKDGSLIVQGLVDSEGRFLDVSAGWPGSMSPSAILPQTKLFSRVEESKELLSGDLYEIQEDNWITQYILGDSCCPLLPWLLTPFPKTSSESQKAFNSSHSRGMGLVSTAFGRVKARWRLLGVKWKEGCVELFPFVIVTGCLLHNFLIKCSEAVPEESEVCSQEQEFAMFEGKGDVAGERIRDALASQLSLKDGQVTSLKTVEDMRLYRLA